jgi:hypothetical protein
MDFAGPRAERIDLHWHLLPDSCWPRADDEFWERSEATALHGIRVSVLEPTDQLFHAFAHGVKWEPVPPLRWIADAALILGDPSVAIDWERLLRVADRLGLVLPVRNGLRYLDGALGLAAPRHIVSALEQATVSRAERWEHRLRTRRAGRVFGRVREHWLRYRRLRRAGTGSSAIGFAAYLQVVLDCSGRGALLRRALLRHRWRRVAEREARPRERALDRAALP